MLETARERNVFQGREDLEHPEPPRTRQIGLGLRLSEKEVWHSRIIWLTLPERPNLAQKVVSYLLLRRHKVDFAIKESQEKRVLSDKEAQIVLRGFFETLVQASHDLEAVTNKQLSRIEDLLQLPPGRGSSRLMQRRMKERVAARDRKRGLWETKQHLQASASAYREAAQQVGEGNYLPVLHLMEWLSSEENEPEVAYLYQGRESEIKADIEWVRQKLLMLLSPQQPQQM